MHFRDAVSIAGDWPGGAVLASHEKPQVFKPGTRGRLVMPKALTITGMVVAVLLALVFLLDLATEFPFKRASTLMDIAFLICALALGYMSWSTWRDLK
jgi:hypothetical protein